YFSFADGPASALMPDNNVPYTGPTVSRFTIDNPSESPARGMPGQTYTYTVRYTSTTNTPPILSEVDIDGVAFPMSPTGTNYQSGVTYVYSTSTLAQGEHYYRYRFDDGTGPAIRLGTVFPWVTPLSLTNSSVTPTSGTTTTSFTFQTTYRDSSGTAP